jgi:hypothetical protein
LFNEAKEVVLVELRAILGSAMITFVVKLAFKVTFVAALSNFTAVA